MSTFLLALYNEISGLHHQLSCFLFMFGFIRMFYFVDILIDIAFLCRMFFLFFFCVCCTVVFYCIATYW